MQAFSICLKTSWLLLPSRTLISLLPNLCTLDCNCLIPNKCSCLILNSCFLTILGWHDWCQKLDWKQSHCSRPGVARSWVLYSLKTFVLTTSWGSCLLQLWVLLGPAFPPSGCSLSLGSSGRLSREWLWCQLTAVLQEGFPGFEILYFHNGEIRVIPDVLK